MIFRIAFVFLLAGIVVSAGCATKTYERMSPLTESEKTSMTCKDILVETAKSFDFMNKVNKGAQASGADVAAQLIDFGIGNEQEKKAALDSAEKRLAQLRELSIARKCEAPGKS